MFHFDTKSGAMMPTTKHRIPANLTDSEFGDLAAMADRYDVSLSWLTRKAVLEFIDRYRNEQLQLPMRPEPIHTPSVHPVRKLNA